MNRYLMLYKVNDVNDWKLREGYAESKKDFLRDIEDHIVEKYQWTIYQVRAGSHKDEFAEQGMIQELIDSG